MNIISTKKRKKILTTCRKFFIENAVMYEQMYADTRQLFHPSCIAGHCIRYYNVSYMTPKKSKKLMKKLNKKLSKRRVYAELKSSFTTSTIQIYRLL